MADPEATPAVDVAEVEARQLARKAETEATIAKRQQFINNGQEAIMTMRQRVQNAQIDLVALNGRLATLNETLADIRGEKAPTPDPDDPPADPPPAPPAEPEESP